MNLALYERLTTDFNKITSEWKIGAAGVEDDSPLSYHIYIHGKGIVVNLKVPKATVENASTMALAKMLLSSCEREYR